MKTIYNLDKVKICLIQPNGFFEDFYQKVIDSPKGIVYYDGFYLKADKTQANDKDISADLYTLEEKPFLLGSFVFNRSKKFKTRCFFNYSTKILYEVASHFTFEKETIKYNYFSMPFYAFDFLDLEFNNVTNLEVVADTDASVIKKIQYVVSHPLRYDMVLIMKQVEDASEILDSYWEYFQRSRIRRSSCPTLYVHSTRASAGDRKGLKIYDKARELIQSRQDKEELVKAWDGMKKNIQRLEVSVENKPFTRFFEKKCNENPNRWMPLTYPEGADKKQINKYALASFFYDLGMNESLRKDMFNYFSYLILHFKLRDHYHTQLSLLGIGAISLKNLKEL